MRAVGGSKLVKAGPGELGGARGALGTAGGAGGGVLGQSGASVPKFAVWEGGVALGFQLEERDGWACRSVREEDILDGGLFPGTEVPGRVPSPRFAFLGCVQKRGAQACGGLACGVCERSRSFAC